MPRQKKVDLAAMEQRIRASSRPITVRTVGPKPFSTIRLPPDVKVVKVIVCGTRDLDDYEFVKKHLDRLTYWCDAVEVVLGSHGKRVERGFEWRDVGADAMGLKWGLWNWWTIKTFWPDWEKLGKKAGPVRNREMAEYVGPEGFCVAFWNKKSPGTANMIDTFRKLCDPEHLRIYRYD